MKRTRPIKIAAPVVIRTVTTRSVATCRSMSLVFTSQYRTRNATYQQSRNPNAPDKKGQLVEDHPHEGERRNGRQDKKRDVTRV